MRWLGGIIDSVDMLLLLLLSRFSRVRLCATHQAPPSLGFSRKNNGVGCHCLLHNGHEFEQTLGDSGGQESLVCCSPRRHKESDMT